jgi:type 1 glutamine amidotransferase
VNNGGRWLALHGTNAALDLPRPDGVEAPRCFPKWAETLGSQFIAHPPIQPYPVALADQDHWLVSDVEPFDTDDELYLMEYHDRASLHTLGHCRGHWDMEPLAAYYPVIERCSWEKPQYYELLRRAIRWTLGAGA